MDSFGIFTFPSIPFVQEDIFEATARRGGVFFWYVLVLCLNFYALCYTCYFLSVD